jgi:hypothetical protein
MPAQAKPRVTAVNDHIFALAFPCGGKAVVVELTDATDNKCFSVDVDHGDRLKRVRVPSYSGHGYAADAETAFRHAWGNAFNAGSFDAWGTAVDIHDLARRCNDDRSLFVKTLKKIARQRFGVKLRVRAGRRKASGWVDVSTTDPNDGQALGVIKHITGYVTVTSESSIRPCGGERVAVICRLAGHPLPKGFTVSAPTWD